MAPREKQIQAAVDSQEKTKQPQAQQSKEAGNPVSDEEKRRIENQNAGDQIEDKLEEFLNKYQDSNPLNGNQEISGVKREPLNHQASSDNEDSSFDEMLDQKYI